MRVEKLSSHQFTIFLTFDDLIERGFTSDEIWHDAASVRSLFSEMMYDASDELDIELDGMLLVQVFMMQAQGMHVVVTQMNDMETEDEDFIEMKVTLDESHELIFLFDDFEDLIDVASYLSPLGIEDGQVYHLNDHYYMLFDEEELPDIEKESLIAIMSEYSHSSILTSYRLKEYGKAIYEEQAIKQIMNHFYN
ncbi:genetic competence negative regulator [Oceanobacillus alkalisoli]|uniref:genetic competence negative regulator n=1 Tax=Oceanobacillus alkalisoli TaxID=2925113 RepID=UPI001EEFD3A6|nr:genetic competence negative regulator [Oceanobacillus alkalisoli]MCF3941665.1 genetic competence negative regulator [Oceanobacillus alkalisoli]MCG5102946.1 genetic competence negative regulator [Oceanobacillus alkalisoli]